MAPTTAAIQASSSSASSSSHLSPAELAYLHTSLSLPISSHGPIRPDGRASTQFRPLTAETDILPGANGSARVGFADGSEAVVGVKAEIVKTDVKQEEVLGRDGGDDEGEEGEEGGGGGVRSATGSGWVDMSIEIPGFRDDDALPVFLAEMMREAVLAGGEGLLGRLRVNRRWHWKIYVDVSSSSVLYDGLILTCGCRFYFSHHLCHIRFLSFRLLHILPSSPPDSRRSYHKVKKIRYSTTIGM